MAIWMWLVQLIVLLVVWKIVHLLFWNMRKMIHSTSLLLTMLITLLIGVICVIFAHVWHSSWGEVLSVAIVLGIANGEYEFNRGASKST